MSITQTTINRWIEEHNALKTLLANVDAGKKVLVDAAKKQAQNLEFVPESAKHGQVTYAAAKERFAELRAKLKAVAVEKAGDYPAGRLSARAAEPVVIIEDMPATIAILEEDQALAAAVIQRTVDPDPKLLRRLMSAAQLEAAGIRIEEGFHVVVGGPK